MKQNYRLLSLSDELKSIYKSETSQNTNGCKRRELQDFGDKLRKEKGRGYLAEKVVQKINELEKKDQKIKEIKGLLQG